MNKYTASLRCACASARNSNRRAGCRAETQRIRRVAESSRPSARRRGKGLVSIFLLLVSTLPAIGCLSDGDLGPWTALSTSQFGVPLAVGTTSVEVRDVHDGWVERVSVESDGRTILDGIHVEPLVPAVTRALVPEEVDYLRGDGAEPIPTTGSAIERASALNYWVGRRIEKLRFPPLDMDQVEMDPDLPRDSSGRVPHWFWPTPPPGPRQGEPAIESENACEILQSIADGARSNCRSYASVLVDACALAGLTARRVDMAVRYGSPLEGHSLVEVWSPELEKWIVVDPFFQAIWTLDSTPASAIELHRAALEGRSKAIGFTSTGLGGASLDGSRVNPRLYPRNLFIRLASGAWLTRTNGIPAPVVDTNILQCDDDSVFAAPPGVADAHAVRRDSLHGRIAFQVIDGRLVGGLAKVSFESGRFEARASAGRPIETFDETVGHDPADPEIATGAELVARTKLVDDDRDGIPDGWTIERPLSRFEAAPNGDAVLESGADGSVIALKPATRSPGTVIGFARMAVERGSASFSLAGRMAQSVFVVRAGRETTACSPISGWSAAEEGLRLELAPNSRVTVAWVSMRKTPKYGDLSGAHVP